MANLSRHPETEADAPKPTRLFKNGDSQAVCIPKALAFTSVDVDVEIQWSGDELIVCPTRCKLSGVGTALRRIEPYFQNFQREQPQQERGWTTARSAIWRCQPSPLANSKPDTPKAKTQTAHDVKRPQPLSTSKWCLNPELWYGVPCTSPSIVHADSLQSHDTKGDKFASKTEFMGELGCANNGSWKKQGSFLKK